MCRLHKVRPYHRSSFFVSSPGRSVTQARRLYESRTANSVKATDPRNGAVNRDVNCRHCAKVPSRHHGALPSLEALLISNVLFESWLQGHSSILGQRMAHLAEHSSVFRPAPQRQELTGLVCFLRRRPSVVSHCVLSCRIWITVDLRSNGENATLI